MNKFKSHFLFSKKQRSGIFLLLIISVVLQLVYFFVDFPAEDVSIAPDVLEAYNKDIDSLRLEKQKVNKPKPYTFNPNFITDYKGSKLGMSIKEIDRLLAYRKQGKWINSVKQFQEVTQVSDTLLHKMAPLFKFPDWVVASKKQKKFSTKILKADSKKSIVKKDLNKATLKDLKSVFGIGDVFANRIIKYRDQVLGGFASYKELKAVYGLTPELITRINNRFEIKTPRKITKLNLNTANTEQLVNISYIDYEVAKNIIEYRSLREGYTSITELTKVKGFPVNKFDIIELYLYIE